MQPFSRMLTYFVEVARQGSVRKAAEQLHVSASAIDRQILAAEEGLGIPLFDRLPSGMRLTAAGELLLRGALDWGKDITFIKRQIIDLSGLRRGHVRVVAIEALNRGFLPRIMALVHKTYPGITLEVAISPNELIADALAAGKYDVGLLLNPQSSKDITVRAFREFPLGAVMPCAHRLCDHKALRFSMLAEESFIKPAKPLELAEQFNALEAASDLTITPVVASNNITLIKALVGLGMGVSVLSRLDAAVELAEGRLCFVALTDSALRPVTLGLCHPKQGRISHAASLFMDIVEAEKYWGL